MLEHIVLMKLKPGVTGAQTAALLAALNGLKERNAIAGILNVTGGTNNSPEGKSEGFDFGFVVTFADASARDAYLPHPEHQALARDYVRPICDAVLVFDFER